MTSLWTPGWGPGPRLNDQKRMNSAVSDSRTRGKPKLIRILAAALAALAVLALSFESARAANRPVVTDIRVAQYDRGTTRVVLEVSRGVDFELFTLSNPYRVVLDLPEVGWRMPARPLPRNTGLLDALRYGLFKPGISRLVLQTHGPVAVKRSFTLVPNDVHGPRLVLDLAPTTKEAFAKEAGAPVPAKPAAPKTETASAPPPPPAPKPEPVSAPAPRQQAKAKPSEAAFRPPTRKPRPAHGRRVVVLDPGHGGIDPGTTGRSGIYEKHITMSMARALKQALEDLGGFEVHFTRTRDVFISLKDRVQFARDKKADLFVSIHADAIKNKRVSGASVYTLSEKASDAEAAALAEKENKVDLIAGIDLSGETQEVTNILIELAQRETMNESARLASRMVGEMRKHTKMLKRTHRFAGFAVLKAPDIPSVLLELGFLSNKRDETNLRNRKYRARMAKAVARSVAAYFVRVEEANRR